MKILLEKKENLVHRQCAKREVQSIQNTMMKQA